MLKMNKETNKKAEIKHPFQCSVFLSDMRRAFRKMSMKSCKCKDLPESRRRKRMKKYNEKPLHKGLDDLDNHDGVVLSQEHLKCEGASEAFKHYYPAKS